MRTITTIRDLRSTCDHARHEDSTIGVVPTMGSLHEGHRTLLRAARRRHDLVVLTIFVNPLQFGEGDDLAAYPRTLDADQQVAASEGVDVVFAPPESEMYPRPPRTVVHVDRLTSGLCGDARPTHFDGVTTVVAKLLNIVGPCTAYFGRKDHQQLVSVRRMVADLDFPVAVVGCPTVREEDGLALSSRNAYLTPGERAAATVLSRALYVAGERLVAGERSPDALLGVVRSMIATQAEVALEYAELRTAEDLEPVDVIDGDVVLAIAARVGAARLIDNLTATVHRAEVDVHLGVVASPQPVPERPPIRSEEPRCVA